VTFPGGLLGIAFNLDEEEVGVILLGDYQIGAVAQHPRLVVGEESPRFPRRCKRKCPRLKICKGSSISCARNSPRSATHRSGTKRNHERGCAGRPADYGTLALTWEVRKNPCVVQNLLLASVSTRATNGPE